MRDRNVLQTSDVVSKNFCWGPKELSERATVVFKKTDVEEGRVDGARGRKGKDGDTRPLEEKESEWKPVGEGETRSRRRQSSRPGLWEDC